MGRKLDRKGHIVRLVRVGRRGYTAAVDDDDYERVNVFRWAYSNGYAQRRSGGKCILMHRMITNAGESIEVDHINGNRLDNRKANLRLCSRSQNMMNVGKRANSKSGYKGVSWSTQRRKWAAMIWKDGKPINLGRFDCKHKAALAFNVAAMALHGEFAFLNKIEVTSV